MKTMRDGRDLENYGINLLTGEACRVGRRVLTDLTERGRRIVADMLGLGDQRGFAENWNSRVGDSPAVASVMLPYSMIRDLMTWCLIHDGCTAIIETDDEYVYGREDSDGTEWDELVEHCRKYHKWVRVITLRSGPSRGTRMVHAMSGRIE
jgi:hypothetical protein